MRDTNRLIILVLTYLLTSCNKEPTDFNVRVNVKDLYSQTTLEGKSVNLISRSRSMLSSGPYRISLTQATDQNGQTTFVDVPVNEPKKTYHLQVSESGNYSKSEYFDLEENSEVSITIHPLLIKKIIVFKSLNISSLNINVHSDLMDSIQFTTDSSDISTHHFKFVTGIQNIINVSMFKGSVAFRDTIIILTPTLNDTSLIQLHL
jgi:hypothetical protein